ncbi:hypothetical protein [Streptomyces sp. NPDC000410]|uniref:hypothetical protein n=1 Tax=Streptomyces sp. NPDC000410 TaxID=3154254 RepID=UPI0033252C83
MEIPRPNTGACVASSSNPSGVGADWRVPYDPGAVTGRHPALLALVAPGAPDRDRALTYFAEQAATGGRAEKHLFALAYLRAEMPFAALTTLGELGQAHLDSIAIRMDLATVAARAGRLALAESVILGCLAQRLKAGMEEEGPEFEEFVARLREVRTRGDRSVERRFLELRIAAGEEMDEQADPDRGPSTEAVLLYARALISLGELDDALPPFQRAVAVLEKHLPQVPHSVRVLETLAEARMGCGPPEALRQALRRLREAAPDSPVLREARGPSLDERRLAELEAHHESRHLLGELMANADASEEVADALEATLRRRGRTSRTAHPYLMATALAVLHRGDLTAARELSIALEADPDTTVTDHLRLAGDFHERGAADDARRHALIAAERARDSEERASAEVLLARLEGVS